MAAYDYTIALERGLLAAIVGLGHFAAGSAALLREDFLDARHRSIFETLQGLAADGAPLDTWTVCQELMRLGRVEEAGGVNYIADLIADPGGDPRLIQRHVRQITEQSARRRTVARLDDFRRHLVDPAFSLESALGEMRATIAEAARSTDRKDEFPLLGAGAPELLAKFASPAGEAGLPTLLGPLDAALGGGLKPGQLVVVAGGTGMGKTSLATQMALGSARSLATRGSDGSILIFSFEMQEQEIYLRLVSQVADVTGSYRPPRGWTSTDRPLAEAAVQEIATLPIVVLDRVVPTVESIVATVERYAAIRGRVDLVVVDHLHLLGAPQVANPTAALAHITRSLKSLAQRMGFPVVALSQINREHVRRDNPQPNLSDLRQSGSIEQDADVVLFVHRPGYYGTPGALEGSDQGPQTAELIIAKHRAGRTGTLAASWLGHRTMFVLPSEPQSICPAATPAPVVGGPTLDDRIVEVVRVAQTIGKPSSRASLYAEFGDGKRPKWTEWSTGQLIDRMVKVGRLVAERDGAGQTAPYSYRLPAPVPGSVVAPPVLRVIAGGATGVESPGADDLDLEAIFG